MRRFGEPRRPRWLHASGTCAICAAVSLCLSQAQAFAKPGAAERAYVEAYVEGLVELGILTQEQADQLRAKAEAAAAEAAKAAAEKTAEAVPPKKKAWPEQTKVGGYVQFRWNDHPDEDGALGDPENDFEVRRARIKVEAKPTDRLEGTLQLDMPVGDGEVEVKDAFGDLYLDDSHETWLRFGQAKVPFGFEIPQSSSRRLPLERSDIRRRTVLGERDVGAWFYYTPQRLHKRFDELKKHHLGTGDYGLVALGLYRGQGINTSDANDDKHFVFRTDYPFELDSGRLGQVGLSVFTGDFVSGNERLQGTVRQQPPPLPPVTVPAAEIDEHAWNFHFYLPPDPWGVQFEYLDGESAALLTPDPSDPNTWSVGKAEVDGWYGQFHCKLNDDGLFFIRYDEMDGFGKRGLGDLPSLNDLERWTFGYAHQIDSSTELTVQYDNAERNGKDDDFFGIQTQYTY